MNCRLHCRALSVIQGDTLDVTVTIENPEELVLSKVYFICPSLGLKETLTPLNLGDDLWGFTISANTTKTLRVGRWDFNIVAMADDGDVFTVLFKDQFIVHYNRAKNDYTIDGQGE